MSRNLTRRRIRKELAERLKEEKRVCLALAEKYYSKKRARKIKEDVE